MAPLSKSTIVATHVRRTRESARVLQARSPAMKYAILMTESAEDYAKRDDPEQAPAYWAAWTAYSQAIAQAGIFVGGAGLMPPAMATTVRVSGTARQVEDGPYSDAKEQLAGFFLIDVPDLDAALAWAKRRPDGFAGAAEVRPVLPPPPSA
jgi:hypothetical protein